MSARQRGWVVDASVGIQLFVIEPLTAQAKKLFAPLAGSSTIQFFVPDLFYGECANILWKYVRRQDYPAMSAQQDLADLKRLHLHSLSTAELVTEALGIAIAREITAYDACYVALARRVALPLVTADEALVRKLAPTAHDVRWLGDLVL